MTRRLLVAILIVIAGLHPAIAQETGWCGYALIQGLPLLSNQLSGFEAITPDKSATINPAYLFQYRFSLDHSEVIIEGCWKTDPTRDLVISLLSQTIQFDPKAMSVEVDAAIQEAVTKGGQVATTAVVRDYVDEKLVYSIFAPSGTRDESAASARTYIAANVKAWEPPEQ